MARSLNRVQLIGNLTRDPELRYTPNGNAVCSFAIATNRNWTTDTGEKKEEVEFHRIVSWNKLAELCSQFLVKGRKVYVEGRLTTRSWTGQDGAQRNTTEIVINEMILLDSRRPGEETHTQNAEENPTPPKAASSAEVATKVESEDKGEKIEQKPSSAKQKKDSTSPKASLSKEEKKEEEEDGESTDKEETLSPDDIPF